MAGVYLQSTLRTGQRLRDCVLDIARSAITCPGMFSFSAFDSPEPTGGDLTHSLHAHGARLGEQEPRRAVGDSEEPAAGDDLLRSGQGADGLGLHWMADGNVALDGECSE